MVARKKAKARGGTRPAAQGGKKAARGTELAVRSIVPCLVFDGRAEEAMDFYVTLFRDARILRIVRSESDGPIPKGKLLHGAFELGGQDFNRSASS